MSDANYIYETRDGVDGRIVELARQASEARAEARHAREHPGLGGVARNAETHAAAIEGEIAELREVAVRVTRGYDWWDRDGFEIALDAYGEPWRWQPLSESVTRDFIFSHDEIDVRFPIEIQRAYGRAFESGFFDHFDVCQWFETEGDDVKETRLYLFGVTSFERLGPCTFLVAQWIA